MASGSQNNTSYQAQKWTNLRAFTIGNTNKDVDGTSNMSWSKDEILGASTDAYFLRGDKAWSNTLNDTFTANGNIIANNGYLKSTTNENTVQIGSQNSGFCHITNTAAIPFWFNQGILMERGKTIGAAGTVYCPFQIYLGRNTTAGSNALNATNPLIEFSNSDRSQYCQLIYTDHDTVQAPDSLTLVGNQNGITFICKNGPIWVQGGSNAGGNVNRLATSAGMPGNMQYNTSRRGTQIYSNGIAFADPYNGNSNSDAGWIRHQETTGNVGELEIAVGDDGDETVVVRQYNTSNGVKRTLTLLSKDGYTLLPSYLNLGGGHEKNASSPTYVWGSNSSDNYLRSYQTSYLSVGRAAADANGYNLNNTYRKEYIQVVDLTSFNASTWYPVTIPLPDNGLRRVGVITQLNSGHKPSWSSHQSGYTAVVEVLTEAGGWGTTNMWSILLIDQQGFLASGQARPVGYSQFSNSSRATFWCRGGAKYRMYSDFFGGWTVYTSSTTVSSQTIAPTTSYPGVSTTIKLLDASGYSHFSRAYNAVWNDYAEFRIAESEEPGYVVIPSNDGIARLTTERLQSDGRIISDTYGHAVGQSDQAKTPIGLAGRVLAYPYRDKSEYKIGDAVCSAPGGTVDIMTREEIMTYPDRIVGIVNEIPDYEVWEQTFSEQRGGGQTAQKVEVKGRIWIDIK